MPGTNVVQKKNEAYFAFLQIYIYILGFSDDNSIHSLMY